MVLDRHVEDFFVGFVLEVEEGVAAHVVVIELGDLGVDDFDFLFDFVEAFAEEVVALLAQGLALLVSRSHVPLRLVVLLLQLLELLHGLVVFLLGLHVGLGLVKLSLDGLDLLVVLIQLLLNRIGTLARSGIYFIAEVVVVEAAPLPREVLAALHELLLERVEALRSVVRVVEGERRRLGGGGGPGNAVKHLYLVQQRPECVHGSDCEWYLDLLHEALPDDVHHLYIALVDALPRTGEFVLEFCLGLLLDTEGLTMLFDILVVLVLRVFLLLGLFLLVLEPPLLVHLVLLELALLLLERYHVRLDLVHTRLQLRRVAHRLTGALAVGQIGLVLCDLSLEFGLVLFAALLLLPDVVVQLSDVVHPECCRELGEVTLLGLQNLVRQLFYLGLALLPLFVELVELGFVVLDDVGGLAAVPLLALDRHTQLVEPSGLCLDDGLELPYLALEGLTLARTCQLYVCDVAVLLGEGLQLSFDGLQLRRLKATATLAGRAVDGHVSVLLDDLRPVGHHTHTQVLSWTHLECDPSALLEVVRDDRVAQRFLEDASVRLVLDLDAVDRRATLRAKVTQTWVGLFGLGVEGQEVHLTSFRLLLEKLNRTLCGLIVIDNDVVGPLAEGGRHSHPELVLWAALEVKELVVHSRHVLLHLSYQALLLALLLYHALAGRAAHFLVIECLDALLELALALQGRVECVALVLQLVPRGVQVSRSLLYVLLGVALLLERLLQLALQPLQLALAVLDVRLHRVDL
mmetsp:Transcript_25504/g.73678  ORF Transcript_25504/g.73678 Transcript_25504/m.73678 type:complete len:746 (-) Transcript_25504:599-2836(-)